MGKTILLIGNEANITYALQAKLSANKFEVVTHNGIADVNEIILFITLNNPDYIIQTTTYPQKFIFDLVGRIKSDNLINSIPIFLIAEANFAGQQEKFGNFGVEYFFKKQEYSIDDLVDKIKKTIDNQEKRK